MNSIELLARILNTYSCEGFLLSSYKQYQYEIDDLINAGLIFNCSIKSQEVFCDKCDEPHYATIQRINNVLKWRCPQTGFHDVDLKSNERDLYKVNLELLINKIQDFKDLKRTKLQRMKTEIEGLYNIGHETFLYISEQNPLADENLYNYIDDKKSRSSRGMVLCTFEDFNNRPYELPRDYKLVPFSKLTFLDNKDNSLDSAKVTEGFTPYHSGVVKKKTGRPSTRNEVADAIEYLYHYDSEFAGFNKTEKATAIHNYLGNPKTPKFRTIYNQITKKEKTA